MSLQPNVFPQNTHPVHDDATATDCCVASRKLEDRGDYDGAMGVLSGFCSRVGEWPNMDGLSLTVQAQLLLRIGVVFGQAGSAGAIEGAGHFAQKLLSCAINLTSQLDMREVNAECHIELGWCLWREGKFNDAQGHYLKAIEKLPKPAGRLKAKATLRLGIAYESASRLQDALTLFDSEKALFRSLEPSDTILIGLHNERALIFQNLVTPENREANFNKAIAEYTSALYHSKKAGNKRFSAAIESNIGKLHLKLNRHDKAFAHLERAGRLFKAIGDVRTFAQVAEVVAQAHIEQGDNSEAERVIAGTIRTLEKAGELSLLCEALITLGTALIRQGKSGEAHTALSRAIEVAGSVDDRANQGQAWLVMLEEASSLHLSSEQVGLALTEAARLLDDSQDPQIKSRLLSLAVSLATKQMATNSHAPDLAELVGLSLKEAVKKFKARYIQEALNAANGNQSAAARQLGMKPQGLNQLLKGTHKHIKHQNIKTYRKSGVSPSPSAEPQSANNKNVLDYVQFKNIKEAKEFIARRPDSFEIQMGDDSLIGKGVRERDTILVECGPVQDGDWVAAESRSGVFMVGQLFRDHKSSVVWLEVANPQCEAHRLPVDAIRRYVGRAYGFYRPDDPNSEKIVRPLL